MMNVFRKMFGMEPQPDLATLVNEGAIILDVRSKSEYASGNVKGSMHIPLDQLGNNLHRFKNKEQVIITCCASGMRSGVAKNMLRQNGFTRVYNGGSWHGLRHLDKK
ncbi:MAG: rhodanese-like domain-containing protein [Bacteroidia bacterium]|jgi:rhodanese-related sulfurtransferase|nr:rhodanese-like domain-containing protein [Bacteroidia bacterium]